MTVRPDDAYRALLAHQRETAAIAVARSLLQWDHETMMPPRGADARGEALAALDSAVHARRTDPRLAEWLALAGDGGDDPVARANIRLTHRAVERALKVPRSLIAELARTESAAQRAWASARRRKSFQDFLPSLAHMVQLKRDEAECLGYEGSPYDPLLDHWEPGARTATVAALFDRLHPRLTALLERINDSGIDPPALSGSYRDEAQMQLASEVAEQLGYDLAAGRIDKSAHPFTSGGVPGDVRITTRTSGHDFGDCLYSIIHEVGHALYEQGIDEALLLAPAGEAVSSGVHESQARLWENQVGRGRALMHWLLPRLQRAFGALPVSDPDDLYRAVNRVRRSLIRTEADEVTYNLHIILRFDLERAVIEDALQPADLEEAFNEHMQRYVGVDTAARWRGCAAGHPLGGGMLRLLPHLRVGQYLRRRAVRPGAARLATARQRSEEGRGRGAARVAPRQGPPLRKHLPGRGAHGARGRSRPHRGTAARLPRGEIRRALRAGSRLGPGPVNTHRFWFTLMRL